MPINIDCFKVNKSFRLLFLIGLNKLPTKFDLKSKLIQQRAQILFKHLPVQYKMSSDRGSRETYTFPIPSNPSNDGTSGYSRWELQIDRDWYDQEESCTVDLSKESLNVAQPQQPIPQRKESLRSKQFHMENEKWETNRMQLSGLVGKRTFDHTAPDEDHDDHRVHLMVHDVRPPFLDGKDSSLIVQQTEMTLPVKDPTSDMAVFAREGSALVRGMRERKERQKAMKELHGANSTLAKLTHQPEVEEELPATEHSTKTEQPSDEKPSLRHQRESLPAFAARYDILRLLRENQIIIVVGETGSGKTTQLAQYLHEEGYSKNGMIGCTQPRRVAAMSVAKRVSEEMGVKLGMEVGYCIRFEDCTSDKTKIKYMTDGILLRELLKDPELDHYSVVIMDEAHERSLHTDLLMGLLRKVLGTRRDLRLIITSATMNSDKFSAFFGSVPVYRIPGRTFPVQVVFTKNPCEDYVESAVRQAYSLHCSLPAGDILIFMSGQEDIEACCEALKERVSSNEDIQPLVILPIYSQLPADLQSKIFDLMPSGYRKCIIATNIAETSLTVDGIVYVIDAGYNKVKVYNPRIGMDALQLVPISQTNAAQRAGRAGRTKPGYCYRLYTECAYRNELLPGNIPEIQRTNLANVVLLLKSLGINDVFDFPFLDAPPRETLNGSMYQLWLLGALSNVGDLTELGKKMVEFPLDPSLSKMLLASSDLGCVSEVVTIVSMLSVPNIFYRPNDRRERADASREKFFVPESDHLTLLNVYEQWKSNGYNDKWCLDHFVHSKSLKKAREVRIQLMDILRALAIEITSCGRNVDTVRRCICSAYFHQAAKLKGVGEYVNLRSRIISFIHPTSALYGLGYTPEYVVYHELMLTQKEYMHCVTAVDPVWLAEMGPMFFSVKMTGWGTLERKKQERRQQVEMQHEYEQSLRVAEPGTEPKTPSASVQTPKPQGNKTAIGTNSTNTKFLSNTPSRTPKHRIGM